jgi:hypothetical protein
MDQPFGHLVQIAGEGPALAYRMIIPIRSYSYVNLPGTNVDPGRIWLKCQMAAVLRLTTTATARHRRARLAGRSRLLISRQHRTFLRSGGRPDHARIDKYSFDRNQSGWCPGL